MRAMNAAYQRQHANELKRLTAPEREQRVPYGGLLIVDEIARLRGKLLELHTAAAPVYHPRPQAPTPQAATAAKMVAPTRGAPTPMVTVTRVAAPRPAGKAKASAKRRRCRGTCKFGMCTCGRKG